MIELTFYALNQFEKRKRGWGERYSITIKMKRGDEETWKRWNEEEFVRFLGKSKGEGTTLKVFKEHSKKDNESKEEEKRGNRSVGSWRMGAIEAETKRWHCVWLDKSSKTFFFKLWLTRRREEAKNLQWKKFNQTMNQRCNRERWAEETGSERKIIKEKFDFGFDSLHKPLLFFCCSFPWRSLAWHKFQIYTRRRKCNRKKRSKVKERKEEKNAKKSIQMVVNIVTARWQNYTRSTKTHLLHLLKSLSTGDRQWGWHCHTEQTSSIATTRWHLNHK